MRRSMSFRDANCIAAPSTSTVQRKLSVTNGWLLEVHLDTRQQADRTLQFCRDSGRSGELPSEL